jgi:hypothetical protein
MTPHCTLGATAARVDPPQRGSRLPLLRLSCQPFPCDPAPMVIDYGAVHSALGMAGISDFEVSLGPGAEMSAHSLPAVFFPS